MLEKMVVHYVLRYRMWSGSSTRIVGTAAEAVEAHGDIRAAGGSLIEIVDMVGTKVSMEQLVAIAAAGKDSRFGSREPRKTSWLLSRRRSSRAR